MFPIMSNSPFYATTEPSVTVRAVRRLEATLPADWTVTRTSDSIVVGSPNGTSAALAIEAKAAANVGAATIVAQLMMRRATTGETPLLVTEYASPALRAQCERNDLSYIDTTGWIWLRLDRPAVFIRTAGATRDPRPPRDGAIARLDGRGAGRIIRGLLDGQMPVGVRDLAARSGVSPGSVSRVLATLDGDDIVERINGRVALVHRRALLERWTTDYSYLKSNRPLGRYLAPRGVEAVLDGLQGMDGVIATGSIAARGALPTGVVAATPLSQVALFAQDPAETASRLGLVSTGPASTNVFIAAPYDDALLARSIGSNADDVRTVPLSQALADLFTLPGRAPDEALQVMDILRQSDASWR